MDSCIAQFVHHPGDLQKLMQGSPALRQVQLLLLHFLQLQRIEGLLHASRVITDI